MTIVQTTEDAVRVDRGRERVARASCTRANRRGIERGDVVSRPTDDLSRNRFEGRGGSGSQRDVRDRRYSSRILPSRLCCFHSASRC